MSRMPAPYSAARGGSKAVVPVSRNAGVPAELVGEIATTHDGRDITRPFTYELEEFRDRRLLGAVDWGVYDRILLDDQVKSCLEQRRSAVVSREWSVIPGDEKDPRSVAAAAALEANLERLDWDGITDKMLYAPFYGVAYAELIWGYRDGLIQWDNIKVRHGRRFREDKDGNLRLITVRNILGEVLPPRKFWTVKVGASDDDQPYGRGLAEWLYWPTLFKRNGVRFWNIFLDKFSVPPVKGVYPRGTSETEIGKLLQSMMALANDSGIAVPEGVVLEFMQVATNGINFELMPKYMDDAISRIILSQTMTSSAKSGSLGSGQAQVHEAVKQELIMADADLNTGSFTRGPARWFTDINFGADVAAPILIRQVEEEKNLQTTAETDLTLSQIGFVRTDASFKDIYGEGYQREAPRPAPSPTAIPGRRPPIDGGTLTAQPREEASFAEPRSLYVYRRLRNAKALMDWAQSQGFKSTLPAGELHVTIAYSTRPVDWMEMGQSWSDKDGGLTVAPGGPRTVEQLGDKGAICLLFACDDLGWRNQQIRDKGASWDHAEYQPHVTITLDGAGVDLGKVEPYQGELLFGPEIFEPIDAGWENDVGEVSFAEAAPATDIVDDATAQIMADEGWKQVADNLGVTSLVDQLAKAGSADEVRAILTREAELGDLTALVEQLARAGFAVRMAGATGEDGAQ